MRGMELLPVETTLRPGKVRTQVEGEFLSQDGFLSPLDGKKLSGYEVHMGETTRMPEGRALCRVLVCQSGEEKEDGCVCGNVFGTYVHGIFDAKDLAAGMIKIAAGQKGIDWHPSETVDYAAHRESQYRKLAKTLRESLDMAAVYGSMGIFL